MKPRKFCIEYYKPKHEGFRGYYRVSETNIPTESQGTGEGFEELIHVCEVVPSSTEVKPKIDWEKVWAEFGVWFEQAGNVDPKEEMMKVEQLVEKQLRGEE